MKSEQTLDGSIVTTTTGAVYRIHQPHWWQVWRHVKFWMQSLLQRNTATLIITDSIGEKEVKVVHEGPTKRSKPEKLVGCPVPWPTCHEPFEEDEEPCPCCGGTGQVSAVTREEYEERYKS